MSTFTTNYGFRKLDLTDSADITKFNSNWDNIDTYLKSQDTNLNIYGETLNNWVNTVDSKCVKKSYSYDATILIHQWSDGIYNFYGYGNNENTVIELLPSQNITAEQLEALQKANIVGVEQGDNYVKVKAFGEVPTINIPVTLIIRGDL